MTAEGNQLHGFCSRGPTEPQQGPMIKASLRVQAPILPTQTASEIRQAPGARMTQIPSGSTAERNLTAAYCSKPLGLTKFERFECLLRFISRPSTGFTWKPPPSSNPSCKPSGSLDAGGGRLAVNPTNPDLSVLFGKPVCSKWEPSKRSAPVLSEFARKKSLNLF